MDLPLRGDADDTGSRRAQRDRAPGRHRRGVSPVALRIGTRGSALARVQAALVADALRAAQPGLRVELVEITTAGDRTQHTDAPMAGWGLGVFVKEIERALLDGQVDLAVHSLKDVPPDVPDGLVLAAIPERADPRDVLVTREGTPFEALPAGARVGTSSVRRAAFLRAARPDLAYVPIRGNVDSRYRKLLAGDYDAIVLARAGLERLGLEVSGVPFAPERLPPAPGQGALAIQVRADDARTLALARALDHPPTAAAVRAERRVMAALEGGCRLPVAALGTPQPDGSQLRLLAAVAAVDGSRVLAREERGRLDDAEGLADVVVAGLRADGAGALLHGGPAVMVA